MHCNYKLKYAVSAALSMIAIGLPLHSFALGLSDIEVKSNLGQPLKASINMLGAADLEGPSCLRLGSNSDLSHVNFKLGNINSAGSANLLLTTTQLVNEPILNLSVVAGCDTVVTRDYVLLLDPPISLTGSDVSINAANNASVVQNIVTNANSSTTEGTSITQNTVTNTQKKKRSVKKATAKSKKRTKQKTKKPTASTQTTNQSAPNIKEASKAPRLSLSGAMPTSHGYNAGLRLDRQLTFVADPNAVVNNEEVAIEDEVTVMNNRLAHLQAQITKLQKQNASLKTDNKLKSEQLIQANASTTLPYVWSILGAGLLLFLGGYVVYPWLRRRQTLVQTHNTDAIWVDTPNNENNHVEINDPAVIPEVVNEDDIFADVDFGINTTNIDDSASPSSMENTFESTKEKAQPFILEDEEQFSVLDHADVFLSHGRATLAIQLLQNHLLEHPKQSVTIWLFLLDLLAKENLQDLYEETAVDCKLHFNVKVAEFSKQDPSTNDSLEDFPHLTKGLEDVWNTPAAIVYLDDVIYNNRLEPRAGLSKNLIEELVLLRSMAQENHNSAEVIQLDEKKLAINEQKEALLESKKAEKLKKLDEAERLAKEKAKLQAETAETSFEFTLVDRN